MRRTETGNFQVLTITLSFNTVLLVGGCYMKMKYAYLYTHHAKVLLLGNKYTSSVDLKLAGACVVYTTFLCLFWEGDWKMFL